MVDKGGKRKAVEGRGSSSMVQPAGDGSGKRPKQHTPQPKRSKEGVKLKGWVQAQFTRQRESTGDGEERDSGDEASDAHVLTCNHCGKAMTRLELVGPIWEGGGF